MDFKHLRGRQDIHLYLGCEQGLAERICDAADHELFEPHDIPKKTGRGSRRVLAVRDTSVADVFKALARRLTAFFGLRLEGFPHPAAHGYVAGRSTLTNATAHLGATTILSFDIKDFFGSISRAAVEELFRRCGMSDAAAELLGNIVCRSGSLPLGLHTSPVIANAVCLDLDRALEKLAPGGVYTRYADDVSMSGPHLPKQADVELVLRSLGFSLASHKWRLLLRGRGLYVTGLSLEDGKCPRVPRSLKQRVLMELHYVETLGLSVHAGRRGYSSIQSAVNKIDGSIRYIRGIEREFGDQALTRWRALLKKSKLAVAYPAAATTRTRSAHFYIDESVQTGADGRQVLLVALVVVEDIEFVRTAVADHLASLLANPHADTDKDALEDEGLHWNLLTMDDRTKVVDLIQALPFRAFVAYTNLASEDRETYDATYRRLLDALLCGRLVRYSGGDVSVVAEETTKVRSATLGQAVKAAYDALSGAGSRRPRVVPSSQILPKRGDEALALPDLVLGVLGDYARVEIVAAQIAASGKGKTKQKRLPGRQATTRFEQVRDKVRAVFDVDGSVVYSRRRPFRPWSVASA